jgi:hypothetical protein
MLVEYRLVDRASVPAYVGDWTEDLNFTLDRVVRLREEYCNSCDDKITIEVISYPLLEEI